MKRSSAASSSLPIGNFPSPGTPNYEYGNGVMQKGWSSERIPAHAFSDRRRIAAAILPYNNGRTLPSKWEDAERWIISPMSGDGVRRPACPAPQCRPKSKSGPLGPPGAAYRSMYSPAEVSDALNMAVRTSPPATSPAVLTVASTREPSMARSASVNLCSESLHPPSQVNCVSRRDAGTQMSPEGSGGSSSSAAWPEMKPSSIVEVRDVQVDERANSFRKNTAVDTRSSEWELSETAKYIERVKSEEAKIKAWENLQKAKAEAAIRKLEVRLEKKRSSSMDKIMNRLRSAQRRAKEMRKSSRRDPASRSPTGPSWVGLLSGCFACHVSPPP